eukprot:Gb_03309 [translate_table: standard]
MLTGQFHAAAVIAEKSEYQEIQTSIFNGDHSSDVPCISRIWLGFRFTACVPKNSPLANINLWRSLSSRSTNEIRQTAKHQSPVKKVVTPQLPFTLDSLFGFAAFNTIAREDDRNQKPNKANGGLGARVCEPRAHPALGAQVQVRVRHNSPKRSPGCGPDGSGVHPYQNPDTLDDVDLVLFFNPYIRMRNRALDEVELIKEDWFNRMLGCYNDPKSLSELISVVMNLPGNPADDLVDVINKNRTAHKVPSLNDNPGLACMALQYIKAYDGNCDEVGPNGKKPPEPDFAETFAPNCGVEVTTLGPISGRLLACQSDYVKPQEAFSKVLIRNDKSLSFLYDKNHTEVGVGIQGTDGGAPYFWCVLFSSGNPNSTFRLQGGTAIKQRPGCYSGTNDPCNAASRPANFSLFMSFILIALTGVSIFVP